VSTSTETLPKQQAQTRWQVWVTWLAYSLVALLMGVLFAENFVFSENLGLLSFREVDDLAFQISLRHIHEVFDSGHLRTIWQRNDYGYGWFYWFPLAVITYPAYWLSKFQGIDWPLIVLPRQYSWAMGLGCLWLMRGMLKQYRLPEWVCAAGVLLFALFPTFGYFCLRFGTVQAVTFFAMLSVYWAVKPYSRFQLTKVMTALAMAGAIKLSGLLIAPAALGLALLRLPKASLRVQAKRLLGPTVLFAILLFTLTNPSFWTFKKQIYISYFDNLMHFIDITRRSDGQTNVWLKFYTGVFSTPAIALTQIILFFFMGLSQKINLKERTVLSLCYLIPSLYLVKTINQTGSLGVYFTAVSFIVIIGLTSLATSGKGKITLALLISLSLYDCLGRLNHPEVYNNNFYFTKALHSTKALATAEAVQKTILTMPDLKHIMVDFTIPLKINSLNYPYLCITSVYNNLSATNKSCSLRSDFIILDTANAIGFKPLNHFYNYLKNLDAKTKTELTEDRKNRQSLLIKNTFDNLSYVNVTQSKNFLIYKTEKH
jgi:hypothetical protein